MEIQTVFLDEINDANDDDVTKRQKRHFDIVTKNDKNSSKVDNAAEIFIDEQVGGFLSTSLVSPSLSTGYSGSESLDSVSNSAESDFTETYTDSMSPINDHSFISTLVSHCVTVAPTTSRDLKSISEGTENDEVGFGENGFGHRTEPPRSESRKKSEIVIVPEINSDFDASESCLQLSVEFSDSESDEPMSLTETLDSERKKKKESFISEIEFRPKTEYLLEISPPQVTDDVRDHPTPEPELTDEKLTETGKNSSPIEPETESANESGSFIEVKNIDINKQDGVVEIGGNENGEESTKRDNFAANLTTLNRRDSETSGLTKWSSQQRLIIVVDENSDEMSASATNITTDVDMSKTIITITTATLTSTTSTHTSQTVANPSTGIDAVASRPDKMTSQVFISSLKESSKFVSCVDIEEKDEEDESDEREEVNNGQDAKVELGPGCEAGAVDTKLKQLEGDPTFFQYFFGCLPCVGNPK